MQYYRAGINSVASFAEGYKQITIKDVPGQLWTFAKTNLRPSAVKKAADDYAAKYIDTSSVAPLNHAIFGIAVVSIIMSMPHARHERDERLEHKYGKGWDSWF